MNDNGKLLVVSVVNCHYESPCTQKERTNNENMENDQSLNLLQCSLCSHLEMIIISTGLLDNV